MKPTTLTQISFVMVIGIAQLTVIVHLMVIAMKPLLTLSAAQIAIAQFMRGVT